MLLEYNEKAVNDILNAADKYNVKFDVNVDEQAEHLFMLYKQHRQRLLSRARPHDLMIKFSEIARIQMSPELLEAVKSELALRKLQGIL